jgi:hypothetical protein
MTDPAPPEAALTSGDRMSTVYLERGRPVTVVVRFGLPSPARTRPPRARRGCTGTSHPAVRPATPWCAAGQASTPFARSEG